MEESPEEAASLAQQVAEAVAEALPSAVDDAVGALQSLDAETARQMLDLMAAQTVCLVFVLAVLLLLVGVVLSQVFTRRLA